MRKKDIEVFSPYNVLDALHIKYGHSKNVKIICPMCRSTTFFMNMENGLGHCFRATCEFKTNHTGYYAAHIGSDLETAREEMYGYMGEPFKRKGETSYITPKYKKKEVKVASFKKEVPIAPIETRDAVYREVVKTHSLTERHTKDMVKRGLLKEEVLSLPYASFGFYDEDALALHFKQLGFNLEGVPGFYSENNVMRLRTLKKGILIPFKDSMNRIQGFQLRKNNEELKTFVENGKTRKENKCNWLSSNGLEKGTSIPAYCHYACDFAYNFNLDRIVPIIRDNTITVTEGGMKGDIIHLLSKRSVIALPGVYALKEFEKELPFLKSIGVEVIEDAFDMDYLSNPDVAKQRERLKSLVEKYGIKYRMKTWEIKADNHSDLKGFDDYLAYHIRGI